MFQPVVLVSGSRLFADRNALIDELTDLSPLAVLVGDAEGADHYAAEWCRSHGVPCRQVAADWRLFGKAAGPRRNAELVRQWRAFAVGSPHVAVLCWQPGASNRGTSDMFRRLAPLAVSQDPAWSMAVIEIGPRPVELRDAANCSLFS